MNNKNFLLIITSIISMSLMISCSNSDDEDPTVSAENKTLAVADTVCIMFRSMTGNSEGGIDGLETAKYKEKHLQNMNGFIAKFDQFVEESSVTFLGETDSVKINGYIHYGYTNSGYYRYSRVISAVNKVFKYKFEDNMLKVFYEADEADDEGEWLVLGYGNKDRIDVYVETKCMAMGSSDKYYWETSGNTGFDVNISISPEQADKLVANQDWQDFFDEMNANWIFIPAGKYYAETFKSPLDMKCKCEGASWSIYKMTYLPVTIE